MSHRAFITPKVLKWARESARMSIETAAAKVPVSVDKLEEWEAGTKQPTINQAQLLAKAYKRPFSLLFLPDIPFDFTPLQDFRKSDSVPLSTAALFIIREIQQKQAWISEINQESEEQPLPFVGRFTISDDPGVVARDILTTLSIDPNNYLSDKPLKKWIDKAEKNGIFISRTSNIHSRLKIDHNELKGFTIADNYAPFVFINSDDWDTSQLFTLAHELAHIWINKSGISSENEILEEPTAQDLNPIEVFCNKVAAEALMPEEVFSGLDYQTFDYSVNVFEKAKKLGVSSLAFLNRSYSLKKVPYYLYSDLKSIAKANFQNFLAKEEKKALEQKHKAGGPSYYVLALNKNGKLFTKIVINYFKSGIINPTTASSLLNVKINDFDKFETLLR